jgi:hypothetical protein
VTLWSEEKKKTKGVEEDRQDHVFGSINALPYELSGAESAR